MPTPVNIPLLNPNEPEALLVALYVQEGQQVAQGNPLCTLETTKSTADLPAETSGYVSGLRLEKGQSVRAGELFCYLAETPGWTPPAEAPPAARAASPEAGSSPPEGLRITQPARALAEQLGIDLGGLPHDRLFTETALRAWLEQPASRQSPADSAAFDATAILVYGGGGHGKALIDLLRALGIYRLVGVIDDGIPPGEIILGLPILGGADRLAELYTQGVRLAVNAVGGIGNLAVRIQVFENLAKAGFACPAVVHPRAFVEPSAQLSPGVQVFPLAYVGSEARLGYGCIVNSGAIVSHECQLGDYANISPGAILAGQVQIGPGALVGMGTTINLRVRVGAGARIGNGSTVKEDVPEKGVVRAGSTWPA